MQPKLIFRLCILMACFPILLAGCRDAAGEANPLVGKWKHLEPTSGITVILEFTADKIRFSSEGVEPAETSYTYGDADTIKYRNLETGMDVEASYSIAGDKLTIAFYGENKIEYTRAK
jgi:hypothetical protein